MIGKISKLNIPLYIISVFSILLCTGCVEENKRIETLPRESKIPSNAVKVLPKDDQYPPQIHSSEWENPVPVSGLVNSAGAEDSPFVTPDGKSLYFTFVPDVSVPPEKQLIDGVTGLYYSNLGKNSWDLPERVILNDDLSLDGCECIQGTIMWFCSVREGNFREVDMYKAELVDGTWVHWQNAGKRLNAEIGIGEMHITPKGNEIYFDGSRLGGKGGHDIWVTKKTNDKWQDPVNLESVNTNENEIRPFIAQDGNELWFSRRYLGSPAVYRSKNIDGVWGEPELIISQFAAEPSLDLFGNIYFAHHFFENGVMIEADIYVAYKISND